MNPLEKRSRKDGCPFKDNREKFKMHYDDGMSPGLKQPYSISDGFYDACIIQFRGGDVPYKKCMGEDVCPIFKKY